MEEKVMTLMRRGAITCSMETSIREVAQIMIVNNIGYCVVLNAGHEVEGVISARSMLKAFGKDLDKLKAEDILLPYTITITPNHPLNEAISVMRKKKIEHLVVISDRPGSKAVLGILRAGDIIGKMAGAQEN